ncbi:MAG: energy-coupling factor transporter transmembrane component T family protein [Coriobacteriales bacterium]
MMNRLAFGSYIPGKSAVHKANAQVKIILACALSLGAFFVESWAGLGLLWLLVVLGYAAARLPLAHALRGVKPVAFILVVTVLCNCLGPLDGGGVRAGVPGSLGAQGSWALAQGWGLSLDGLAVGAFFALRIALLVAACCLLSFSTSQEELLRGLRTLLGPLRHLRVPVDDLCMVASMALRFLPLVSDELQRVRRGREARGMCFEGAGAAAAVRAWCSVLVPVMVGLFKRADRLAVAMDARCYGTGPRTALCANALRGADIAALAAGLAIIAALGILL